MEIMAQSLMDAPPATKEFIMAKALVMGAAFLALGLIMILRAGHVRKLWFA